ncbi:MAG: hypothetical protein QUU85_16870, partial [Candidatus Eisenbacteria bacterium]|nr:hypothetical protein [Candidatus Eisenbacteria bacterium]
MSSSFAKPFARPFARPLGLPLAACCLSLLLVPAAGVAPAVAEPAAEAVQGSADSTVAAQRDAALARLASGAESEESTLEDAASALLSQAILATRDPKGPEGRAFSSLWSRVLARVLSHPEPERAGWSRACLALCLPGTYAGESWKLPARLCPARMPALADSIAATLCAGADSVEARGRVILAFAREPEIDALSGFPHARAYWRQPPGGG